MRADKARRLRISHECRGVSPRRRHASHTSPGVPTFATQGVPESRASKVIRRRVLSVFPEKVELLALRGVAARPAAQWSSESCLSGKILSARCTGGVVAARQPLPWGGCA